MDPEVEAAPPGSRKPSGAPPVSESKSKVTESLEPEPPVKTDPTAADDKEPTDKDKIRRPSLKKTSLTQGSKSQLKGSGSRRVSFEGDKDKPKNLSIADDLEAGGAEKRKASQADGTSPRKPSIPKKEDDKGQSQGQELSLELISTPPPPEEPQRSKLLIQDLNQSSYPDEEEGEDQEEEEPFIQPEVKSTTDVTPPPPPPSPKKTKGKKKGSKKKRSSRSKDMVPSSRKVKALSDPDSTDDVRTLVDGNFRDGVLGTTNELICNRYQFLTNSPEFTLFGTPQCPETTYLSSGPPGPATRLDTYREEVLAAHIMKELTGKYGSRGRPPQNVFLQAVQDEITGLGRGEPTTTILRCHLDDEVKGPEGQALLAQGPESQVQGQGEGAQEDKDGLPARLAKLHLERPAALVTQSSFIRRLEEMVRHELSRTGCMAPVFEVSWLFNEVRREVAGLGLEDLDFDAFSVRDALQEPEEKLFSRLKIYKRALTSMILHFEALRPLLFEIKRAYDSVLALKDRQLGESAMIKTNIHLAEKRLDERFDAVRYEGAKQLAALESQCMILLRHTDKQDAAIRTMSNILGKLEAALTEQFELRRDSEDQRRLLIVDINELRKKLGLAPRINNAVIDEDDGEEEEETLDVITSDDPLILRAALETTRKNLEEASNRLLILEADYTDVIPRHDFEDLKTTMAQLEDKHAATIETYDTLNSQVDTFKAEIEKLLDENSHLQEAADALRLKATPRPSWAKVGDYIDGGSAHWDSVSKGKTSNELVDKLIHELTGKRIGMPPEYMSSLGRSERVPRFLRYDNRVRARVLSRRDVSIFIQDIWQARTEELELARKVLEAKEEEALGIYNTEPSGGGGRASLGGAELPDSVPEPKPFPEFVADYFEARYHLEPLRMEWTYNIVEACKRLGATQPRLAEFLGILETRTDEVCYHSHRATVGGLRDALIKKSGETGQPTGSLVLSLFVNILAEVFPIKTEDELLRLLKAASRQTGTHAPFSVLKYTSFFVMTDEGLVGEFQEELAKQAEEDRLTFANEILAELCSRKSLPKTVIESPDDPAGETEFTVLQFYLSLTSIDPSMPEKSIGAALAWVFFGVSSIPGVPARGLHLVEYIKNLIRRSGVDGNEDDEHDDEDFLHGIRDLRKETEEDDEMSVEARRAEVKKLKVKKLRLIARALKGGALHRFGLKAPRKLDPKVFFGDLAALDPGAEEDKKAGGGEGEGGPEVKAEAGPSKSTKTLKKSKSKKGKKKGKGEKAAAKAKSKSPKKSKSKKKKK